MLEDNETHKTKVSDEPIWSEVSFLKKTQFFTKKKKITNLLMLIRLCFSKRLFMLFGAELFKEVLGGQNEHFRKSKLKLLTFSLRKTFSHRKSKSFEFTLCHIRFNYDIDLLL